MKNACGTYDLKLYDFDVFVYHGDRKKQGVWNHREAGVEGLMGKDPFDLFCFDFKPNWLDESLAFLQIRKLVEQNGI